jgi:hypothetical protein
VALISTAEPGVVAVAFGADPGARILTLIRAESTATLQPVGTAAARDLDDSSGAVMAATCLWASGTATGSTGTKLLVGDGSPTSQLLHLSDAFVPCAVAAAPPGGSPDERFWAFHVRAGAITVASAAERPDHAEPAVVLEPGATVVNLEATGTAEGALLMVTLADRFVVYSVTVGFAQPPCSSGSSCASAATCRQGRCIEHVCDVLPCAGPGQQCVAGLCLDRTVTATEVWSVPAGTPQSAPRLLVTPPPVTGTERRTVSYLAGSGASSTELVTVDLVTGEERRLPLGAATQATLVPFAEQEVLAYAGPYRDEPDHRSAWYRPVVGQTLDAPRRLVPGEPILARSAHLQIGADGRHRVAYLRDEVGGPPSVVVSMLPLAADERASLTVVASDTRATAVVLGELPAPAGDPLPMVAYTFEVADRQDASAGPLSGATLALGRLASGFAAPVAPTPLLVRAEGLSERWRWPELVPLGAGQLAVSVSHQESEGFDRILLPVDALGQPIGPALQIGPQLSIGSAAMTLPPSPLVVHDGRLLTSRVIDGRVTLDEVVCREVQP